MNDFIFQKSGLIKKRFIFYLIPTILWICLIFSFSLQSGEDSSQISTGFGAWLVEHVLSFFSDIFESMSAEQLDGFHFLIRKCAHFSEFFVLGILMVQTLMQVKVVHKIRMGIILCIMVAATDESIQLFVAGRSGQISDVLLDSVGSLVGIFVLVMLHKWRQRRFVRQGK